MIDSDLRDIVIHARHDKLSPRLILVYLWLLAHADAKGRVTISRSSMASVLEIRDEHIRRAEGELEEKGRIKIVGRWKDRMVQIEPVPNLARGYRSKIERQRKQINELRKQLKRNGATA